jgi:hypothetical protein
MNASQANPEVFDRPIPNDPTPNVINAALALQRNPASNIVGTSLNTNQPQFSFPSN